MKINLPTLRFNALASVQCSGRIILFFLSRHKIPAKLMKNRNWSERPKLYIYSLPQLLWVFFFLSLYLVFISLFSLNRLECYFSIESALFFSLTFVMFLLMICCSVLSSQTNEIKLKSTNTTKPNTIKSLCWDLSTWFRFKMNGSSTSFFYGFFVVVDSFHSHPTGSDG